MKKAFILMVLLLVTNQTYAAKNIILFIGDGMGQGIVTAARLKYKKAQNSMYLDHMPYTAIVKTYSYDSPVTDSAAAATALGCGVKTLNDVLGQDATAVPGKKDGKPVTCISEIAKTKGKSVGLVTTTEITHATPAAFYAKINHRDLATSIAKQLLMSNFDLFLGGGKKYFDTDAIVKEATSVVLKTDKKQLLESTLPKGKKVLGLFAEKHLSYELTRPESSTEPSLSEMTHYAIESLSKNTKGFFLMVEGGRIDHALHGNMTAEALYETHQFDETIGVALELLKKKKILKNTLVLVTADHETGGLSINGYPSHEADISKHPNTSYASGPLAKAKPQNALILPPEEEGHSALHTGIDVTLFATGNGAHDVHGTLDNTDVFKLMKNHLK